MRTAAFHFFRVWRFLEWPRPLHCMLASFSLQKISFSLKSASSHSLPKIESYSKALHLFCASLQNFRWLPSSLRRCDRQFVNSKLSEDLESHWEPSDSQTQTPLAPTRIRPPLCTDSDFDLKLTQFRPLGAMLGQNWVNFRSRRGPNQVGVSRVRG